MAEGYIKLWRKIQKHPIYFDFNARIVFEHLLIKAVWEGERTSVMFKGKQLYLKPGQLVISRYRLAKELRMRPSTGRNAVYRLRDRYSMLDTQEDSVCTLVSILNWGSYQGLYPKGGQRKGPVQDQSRTSRGPVEDTNIEGKKVRRKETYYVILDYLNQKTGSDFKRVERNFELIQGRLDEGYLVDDFKLVIDKKVAQWNKMPAQGQKDMRTYLRPSTLFRAGNFESYINEPEARTAEDPKEVVDKFMREHA